jgi:hypothetical protein
MLHNRNGVFLLSLADCNAGPNALHPFSMYGLSLACVASAQDITQVREANTVHIANGNVVLRKLPDGEVWGTFGLGGELVGVRLFKRPPAPGEHFRTDMVVNFAESDIVEAPQSEVVKIDGDCQAQVYQIFATVLYSGKNRSGTTKGSGRRSVRSYGSQACNTRYSHENRVRYGLPNTLKASHILCHFTAHRILNCMYQLPLST